MCVGCALGLVFGAVYYLLTEYLVRSAKPGSLVHRLRVSFYTSALARTLRLRDSWLVSSEGSIDADYTRFIDALMTRADATHTTHAMSGTNPAHLRMMLLALAEADHCDGTEGAFSVGCVIAASGPQLENPGLPLDASDIEPYALATGYSRELPGNTHAEECALEKLLRYCVRTPEAQSSRSVSEALEREPLSLVLYTTMEPCSNRLSGNVPCLQRILQFNRRPPVTTAMWLSKLISQYGTHGAMSFERADCTLRPLRIAVVVQGVREPADFVQCKSSRLLNEAGIAIVTASPRATPAALGLTCPNLVSTSLRVAETGPNDWLEDVCLRMARKGHAPT